MNQNILLSARAYTAAALAAAAVFSSPVLSVVPILLLLFYLYLWWRPISAVVNLLTDCFILFALALLFIPVVGTFYPLLISLPVLIPIHHSLLQTSQSLRYRESERTRRLTGVCIALLTITGVTLIISALLGALTLALACVIILVYLAVLITMVVRGMPAKPVEEHRVKQRMVAGSKDTVHVRLGVNTRVGGTLFLESPHGWLKVERGTLSLRDTGDLGVDISLSPPLSGPATIRLTAYATDRWGLIQSRFEIEPIELYVIPRARYAAWLARKYLQGTKPGALPLVSTAGVFEARFGFRRGMEYYGDRPYQAGDRLKDIDWKHSVKLNELISKEFSEFRGQSAIVLVNLAAADAEEGDKLAYSIIVTALSLAQENIPSALAAYDHRGVRVVTSALSPRELVTRSLEVAGEIVFLTDTLRYLAPPDVSRLRANISRIRSVEGNAAGVLTQLLQMEYQNLDANARLNPATAALLGALARGGGESNIVVISRRNHDAEALAFNTFAFQRKGHAIIDV